MQGAYVPLVFTIEHLHRKSALGNFSDTELERALLILSFRVQQARIRSCGFGIQAFGVDRVRQPRGAAAVRWTTAVGEPGEFGLMRKELVHLVDGCRAGGEKDICTLIRAGRYELWAKAANHLLIESLTTVPRSFPRSASTMTKSPFVSLFSSLRSCWMK